MVNKYVILDIHSIEIDDYTKITNFCFHWKEKKKNIDDVLSFFVH